MKHHDQMMLELLFELFPTSQSTQVISQEGWQQINT